MLFKLKFWSKNKIVRSYFSDSFVLFVLYRTFLLPVDLDYVRTWPCEWRYQLEFSDVSVHALRHVYFFVYVLLARRTSNLPAWARAL